MAIEISDAVAKEKSSSLRCTCLHFPLQVVGFVKFPSSSRCVLRKCTKIHTVAPTFHHTRQIIIGTHTERACTQTKTVDLLGTASISFLKSSSVLFRIRGNLKLYMSDHLVNHRFTPTSSATGAISFKKKIVGTKFFCINIIITVQSFLELFHCKTFSSEPAVRQSYWWTSSFIILAHLLETGFSLSYFFRGSLFRIRRFKTKDRAAMKAAFSKRSVLEPSGIVGKVRTCPVQYRHKVGQLPLLHILPDYGYFFLCSQYTLWNHRSVSWYASVYGYTLQQTM